MIEHLTQNQVEDYCRQRLRRAELLSVSDHLGECEACRRQVERTMNGNALFFALRSETLGDPSHLVREHPTVEQTARYVDGNLAGEEYQVVADHLTNCDHCALAVEDLLAFSSEIAPSLDRGYHPAPVSSPDRGRSRPFVFLPALFRGSTGLAFGAAMTVVLLAVSGWLIWRTLSEREPKPDIAVAPTPPPPQPAPAPPVTQLVAKLTDGEGQLTLDQEGNLSGADELPPAYQSMLKEALTNRRIERSPQLKGLTRPPSPLMSAGKQENGFFVIEPVGRVMMTDRPTFRWSSMEGATGYVVEIYDSKFNLVATSPQLTGRLWTVPQSLSRGGEYAWQVKAIKDGQEFKAPRPPAPQARFRILDRAKADELSKAKRAYASSHLTLGLLYAEAGLLKEAEQELRMLQKANPDSEIARSLLSQVLSLQR